MTRAGVAPWSDSCTAHQLQAQAGNTTEAPFVHNGMDLLVLGATGRTGRRAVAEALARGHKVTALVRRPGSAPAGTVEVNGEATNEVALKNALEGKDAVLIALAGSAKQGYEVLSAAAEAVIKAMEATGVGRVVMICSSGVLDADDGGYRGKNLADEFKPIFAEHLKAYRAFDKTNLDWTILCPPNLPEGDYSGSLESAVEALPQGLGFSAYTGDVAHLMIDVLEREGTFGKRVGVVSRDAG
jgi:uncharacterized protein